MTAAPFFAACPAFISYFRVHSRFDFAGLAAKLNQQRGVDDRWNRYSAKPVVNEFFRCYATEVGRLNYQPL